MVLQDREIPQPDSTQSGDFRCFLEQTRRVTYMESEIGRTQPENFRDHHQQQQQQHLPLHALPHLHPRVRPHLHPHFFPPPHTHDVHEAIQREIEKERIREEIIMSEIMRRRVLEAEVRRELMMERELALRRGSDGFPVASSATLGFGSSMWVPLHLGSRADEKFLEERSMLSRLEREGLNGGAASAGSAAMWVPQLLGSRANEKCLEERSMLSCLAADSGGSAALPFQRGSTDLRISEVKHVSDGGKEKEKIILLAKPDENISGSKRKATTSPRGVAASELPPPDGILKKKAKEEWSCALCQVSATSEQGLKQHLQGKKHKNREAALTAQRGGRNYTIGLFPKKVTNKSIPVQEAVDPDDVPKSSTSESLPVEVTMKTSPEKNINSDNPEKNQPLISEKSEKNQAAVVQRLQKDGNPQNAKPNRLWCQICQVRVPSRKVMDSHTRGKKHIRRLASRLQNDGGGSSDQNGKVVITQMNDGRVAGEGGKMASCDADESVKEGALKDDKTMDAVKLEDTEHVNGIEEEDGGVVDVAEPDDGLAKPDLADEPNDDDEFVKEGGLEDGKTMDSVKPADDKRLDKIGGEDGGAMDVAEPDCDLAKPDVAAEPKEDEPAQPLSLESKIVDYGFETAVHSLV